MGQEHDEIEKTIHERKVANLEIINILKQCVEVSNMNFEGLLIRVLDSVMLKPGRSSVDTLETIKRNLQ